MGMDLNSVGGIYQKAAKGFKTAKVAASEQKNISVSNEAKAENADKLSISASATEKYEVYRMTKAVMKEMNETDNSGKIAALREKIQSNTYQIPAEAIAEKMMARFTED